MRGLIPVCGPHSVLWAVCWPLPAVSSPACWCVFAVCRDKCCRSFGLLSGRAGCLQGHREAGEALLAPTCL